MQRESSPTRTFPPPWSTGRKGRAIRAMAVSLGWLPLLPAQAFSEDVNARAERPQRIDLRATLTSEAAIAADGDLQKWDIRLDPEITADLGAAGRLKIIGRLRADLADQLEPGRPLAQNDVRSPVSRRTFAGDRIDAELREFYLDAELAGAFLRLGKQQVVWGEADGLRVLDLINPLSFREFILPELEDRRIPTWMANVELPLGALTAQFLWIPDHTYDEVPAQGTPFAFTSPRFVPALPVNDAGPVVLEPVSRPGRFLTDDDYGVRLTGFAAGWDFSLNYLYHYQDQAVFFRSPLPEGGGVLRPSYERTHVIGASGSTAIGKYTLRSEAAYSTDRYFLTGDPADTDGVFRAGELGYVVGLDYMPDADWFLSGQLFQSVLTNRPAGAVRDRTDSTVSFLVTRTFRNNTASLSAQLLQSLNEGDGQLSLSARHDLRDNIALTLGLDLFQGDRKGLFGQFRDADRLTLTVGYGF